MSAHTTAHSTKRDNAGRFTKRATAHVVDVDFVDHVHSTRESVDEPRAQDYDSRRPVAAFIANIATVGLGAYAGVHFAAWLGVGVVLFTGSTFLGLCVAMLAAFKSMLQAIHYGKVVGDYVNEGRFEHDYARAKAYVGGLATSLFKRNPVATK